MRQTYKGLDYTTRDYEGFRTLMMNKLSELMPEYTDKRQSDAGIVILELNAMCLDILSYYLDSVANECFLVTAEQRSSVMKFCKMLGYTPRFATSAVYEQIFIKSDPSRALLIPKGTKVKTESLNPNNEVYFTTLEDLTLEAGVVGDEKDEEGNYLHTVKVIHGLFVNSELLTANAGTEPSQRYALKYAPVLINDDLFNLLDEDLFKVYVANLNQGEGSQMWNRVNTFAGADSSSKVYTIENNDYNELSVIFGDGSFGLIPSNSTITCSYIVGGGEVGNVGLGAIRVLEDNIAGVIKTENVAVVTEGAEAETVEEIRVNAPISHRSIWGALTVDDFAGVVKINFPTVDDAEAKKSSNDWTLLSVDDIEIYILTKEEIQYAKENDLRYIPIGWYVNNTEYNTLVQKIKDFFDSNTSYVDIGTNTVLDSARKLAGTRDIIIRHANFAELDIKCTLIPYEYYDKDAILSKISEFITDYFSIGNLKYGEDVSLKNLAHTIINNSGIEGIRYLDLTLNNVNLDTNGTYTHSLYTYVNNDLLVPNTGTLFAVTAITPYYPVI